jgi:L-fuconolactonase
MFGSDWPVCLLAASYGRVMEALATNLEGLTAAERDAIFSGTATRAYRLG